LTLKAVCYNTLQTQELFFYTHHNTRDNDTNDAMVEKTMDAEARWVSLLSWDEST